MKPEKIRTAIAEIANDAAGTWKNKFTSEARINNTKPITRNFPIKLKSRFEVVAITLMTIMMPPVPAAARPMSSGPFFNESAIFKIKGKFKKVNLLDINSSDDLIGKVINPAIKIYEGI